MGTRADFYIGKGYNAEWIGSRTHDGYPSTFRKDFVKITTEQEFRDFIKKEIENDRIDNKMSVYVSKEDGWPWFWETSRITDYSYHFIEGRVWARRSASTLFLLTDDEDQEEADFDFHMPTKFEDFTPKMLEEIGCGGLHNPHNVTSGGFFLLTLK